MKFLDYAVCGVCLSPSYASSVSEKFQGISNEIQFVGVNGFKPALALLAEINDCLDLILVPNLFLFFVFVIPLAFS